MPSGRSAAIEAFLPTPLSLFARIGSLVEIGSQPVRQRGPTMPPSIAARSGAALQQARLASAPLLPDCAVGVHGVGELPAVDAPGQTDIADQEVDGRKQAMTDQLERIGATLEDYLTSEEKTEEQIDQELTDAATEGVRIQLLLDTVADAEDVQVSDDEFGHEIVHRAQRAGMAPQQYYDQLVRSGAAAAVFGDVRRGKALAAVMERITIKDSAGNEVTLDALRAANEAEHNHEH